MRFNLRQKLVQHREQAAEYADARRVPKAPQSGPSAYHTNKYGSPGTAQQCSDETKEGSSSVSDRSSWDWKALEFEMRSRAMAPDTAFEGGVIVQSYDPYESAVNPTPSSLGDVIRKVALLRTPLNYDDPDETSPERQLQWLQAVRESIELSRISDTVLREVDDCLRDPAPDDVEQWEKYSYSHWEGEEEKEAPPPLDASIVAVAQSMDDTAASTWRTIRSERDALSDGDDAGTLHIRGMKFLDLSSPALTCDAVSVVPTATTRCYSGTNHDVSAQVDGILNILEDTSFEELRDNAEEEDGAKRQHPTIERRATSLDDDISVSSMEYLFNWLTCTEVEEVLAAKKCGGDKAVETVTSQDREVKPTRSPSPRKKPLQSGPAANYRKRSQSRGRSESPLKRFTNRKSDAKAPRTPQKVKRHFLEKSSNPPHYSPPSPRQPQLGRNRSVQRERGQATKTDLTAVSVPSLDGGSDGPTMVRCENTQAKTSTKKRQPNIYPEAPRFQVLRRGGVDSHKDERPNSNMRSNRSRLRGRKQAHP